MSTTTTTTSPVEAIAAPARLDVYRQATFTRDPNIDVFLAYLRELSTASVEALTADGLTYGDASLRRSAAFGTLQASVEMVAASLTRLLSADVRSAPCSALGEALRDLRVACGAEDCGESVLPWEGELDYRGVAMCSRACFERDLARRT